jgi:hypothetical protein
MSGRLAGTGWVGLSVFCSGVSTVGGAAAGRTKTWSLVISNPPSLLLTPNWPGSWSWWLPWSDFRVMLWKSAAMSVMAVCVQLYFKFWDVIFIGLQLLIPGPKTLRNELLAGWTILQWRTFLRGHLVVLLSSVKRNSFRFQSNTTACVLFLPW